MICQHFWPEEFRINDICKSWTEMGYDVDVLCGIPNYPHGKFFKDYSLFKKRHEIFEGINIYRTFVIPRGKGNPIQVFLNYISFPINSLFQIWNLSKKSYDKILVYQLTPLFMAFPAIIMKKLLKKEIYIYVQDLWPESLYSVYNFKSKIYRFIFDKLSDHIYKKFDYYLTTSKGIKEKIEYKYKVSCDKVLYLPNWAEKVYDQKRKNINLQHQYKNTFNIMFAGNIGPAQSFETIIKAAQLCVKQGNKDIRWIMVGDGLSKKWAENKVIELGLADNVVFLGRKPVASMPEYYDIADVLLVSLTKSELFSMTIPSKIQSYLASGKPILASLDGEGAQIITESGAGYACESENPEALYNIVQKMYLLSEEERLIMGQNGRSYYLENFEKEALLTRLTKFVFNDSL